METTTTTLSPSRHAAIIAAVRTAQPSLTHREVMDFIHTARRVRPTTTHYLVTTSMDEVVEWILQGIEE